MIRAQFGSLAAVAVLIAGCSSNPTAASNQVWPIPQLDAAFGDPRHLARPPEPLDAHKPGYLPAYPSYQPMLAGTEPPAQQASTAEATAQPPEAQPTAAQSAAAQPPEAQSTTAQAPETSPFAFQGPGGVAADEQPNATPPEDAGPPDVSPLGIPQTHAAVGGGSGYVR